MLVYILYTSTLRDCTPHGGNFHGTSAGYAIALKNMQCKYFKT